MANKKSPGKKTGDNAAATTTSAAGAETQTTTTTTAAAPAVVAVKAPSKTSLAKPIFEAALAVRQKEITDKVPLENRVYKTNKDFRLGVCNQMAKDLQVSLPSAGSMYNTFKQEVEAQALKDGIDLGLGRDPKKEKPAKKPRTAKVVVTGTETPAATETVQQEPAAAQ